MPKFYSVRRTGPGIGVGMYSSKAGLRACGSYETTRKHPSPWADTALKWDDIGWFLGVPQDQCYFGFASLDQLKAWLYRQEWREHLHLNGFVVKMWDLPEEFAMHSGNAQAVATSQALMSHECSYLSLLDLEPMELDF